MLVAFLVAAFAILCIRVPSVWFALMATDEPSDARELSLIVASRAYYLPPLRSLSTLHEALTPAPLTRPHRQPFPTKAFARAHPPRVLTLASPQLNQANTRRRRTSATAPRSAPRSAPRQFALPTQRQRAAPWMRMPKHFGLQHH
ncbi:hypothetical protein EDB85DRAFT_2148669 [Lactarius pseudohatsudake]|nr:hypothetical protein EDB85DRAFT_2150482 [Lactarius pseudohatsudake]KAH9027259.1 hypothetical protein EDB85DRAFT_2148669 [Lactarius pseudohatsudake]